MCGRHLQTAVPSAVNEENRAAPQLFSIENIFQKMLDKQCKVCYNNKA